MPYNLNRKFYTSLLPSAKKSFRLEVLHLEDMTLCEQWCKVASASLFIAQHGVSNLKETYLLFFCSASTFPAIT